MTSLAQALSNQETLLAGAATLPFLSAGLGGLIYGLKSNSHKEKK